MEASRVSRHWLLVGSGLCDADCRSGQVQVGWSSSLLTCANSANFSFRAKYLSKNLGCRRDSPSVVISEIDIYEHNTYSFNVYLCISHLARQYLNVYILPVNRPVSSRSTINNFHWSTDWSNRHVTGRVGW